MSDETMTPETIKVTYTDGTSENYTNCTGYENNGTIVKFTGKIDGQSDPKKWELNWSQIRKIERT